MTYKYHSPYLTKRAAKLLQEIPKPEGVDDFTYRRLAHSEFHPLLEHRDYVWLWSRAHEGYFLSQIDPRGARASTAWSLINADEWNEFQRTQLALIDSAPQALFEGLQPVGWGCAKKTSCSTSNCAQTRRESLTSGIKRYSPGQASRDVASRNLFLAVEFRASVIVFIERNSCLCGANVALPPTQRGVCRNRYF